MTVQILKEFEASAPEVCVKRLKELLESGVIQVEGDEVFFPSKDDPFGEEPKNIVELVSYVTWNTAALFYKEHTNDGNP